MLTQNEKTDALLPAADILAPRPGPPDQLAELESKVPRRKKKSRGNTEFTSVLRFFNLLVGVSVIVFGVVCYTQFAADAQKLNYVGYILPGYIAVSGLLIVLIELNIRFIVRNMRFLYNYFGRGLFNIYVGVMPLCLIVNNTDDPQNQTFQIIIIVMVSLMCLIGVMYVLAKVLCCAKEGDRRRRSRSRSRSRSNSGSDSD